MEQKLDINYNKVAKYVIEKSDIFTDYERK